MKWPCRLDNGVQQCVVAPNLPPPAIRARIRLVDPDDLPDECYVVVLRGADAVPVEPLVARAVISVMMCTTDCGT